MTASSFFRRLVYSKPKGCAYPKVLKTLGDHIRKRRLDLGLMQKEVGQRMGLCCQSVMNWERNYQQPEFDTCSRLSLFWGMIPGPSQQLFRSSWSGCEKARGGRKADSRQNLVLIRRPWRGGRGESVNRWTSMGEKVKSAFGPIIVWGVIFGLLEFSSAAVLCAIVTTGRAIPL